MTTTIHHNGHRYLVSERGVPIYEGELFYDFRHKLLGVQTARWSNTGSYDQVKILATDDPKFKDILPMIESKENLRADKPYKGLELKTGFCDGCGEHENFLNGHCEFCGQPDSGHCFENLKRTKKKLFLNNETLKSIRFVETKVEAFEEVAFNPDEKCTCNELTKNQTYCPTHDKDKIGKIEKALKAFSDKIDEAKFEVLDSKPVSKFREESDKRLAEKASGDAGMDYKSKKRLFDKIEDDLVSLISETGKKKLMDKFLQWMSIRNDLNQAYVDFIIKKLDSVTPKNCLAIALRFWEHNRNYRPHYDGDHVITLKKPIGNFYPLHTYGYDHLVSSFTLDEHEKALLAEVMEVEKSIINQTGRG